ncbi:MAG: hypothetical protein AAFY88_02165, partial [Acidobacteriota bacterium]
MSLRYGLMSLALASLFAVTPASGLCGDVCEISIREDAIAVSLPLEGWIYPQNASVQVTLIEPPVFGTWALETYTPSDDFLMAGGDRMRFEVRDLSTGVRTRSTVLINVGTGLNRIFEEDFESVLSVSDLSSDFHVDGLGQMSLLTDAVTLDRSLQISTGSSGPDSSLSELTGTIFGDGRNSARIVGVVNASPPDDPFSFAAPFTATVLELGDLAYTQLRYTAADGYQFRAVGGVGITCVVCETPWRSVQAGHDYRVRLSFGRNSVQHPDGSNRYNLEVRYLDLDGTWQAEDLLEDVSVVTTGPSLSMSPGFGVFDVTGGGQAELTFDDTEAYAGVLQAPPLDAQVEDFLGGSWSPDWAVTGAAGSALAATISGVTAANEWEGVVSFTGANNLGGGWWSDSGPDNSSTLWAHMQVDFGRLRLPKWSGFVLMEGRSPADVPFLELRVRAPSLRGQQVLLRSRDGSGAFQATPWLDVPRAEVDIDVAWNGAKGTLDLWLDGQLQASLDMLPGPYRIDKVGFGISALSLTG